VLQDLISQSLHLSSLKGRKRKKTAGREGAEDLVLQSLCLSVPVAACLYVHFPAFSPANVTTATKSTSLTESMVLFSPQPLQI
jgi:hypothetical protein